MVLTYSCYHTDRGAKGEGGEGGREGWKVVGGQERRGRGRVGRDRRTIYSSQTICSKAMWYAALKQGCVPSFSLEHRGSGTAPADPATSGPMFVVWCLQASKCDLRS